jgi:hypothetical protein
MLYEMFDSSHLTNDGLQLCLRGNNLITSILMTLAIINKERMLGEKWGGLLCAYYAKLPLHVTGSKSTCKYYTNPLM